MISYIAKAITALIVVFLALLVGAEGLEEFNIDELEALIVAAITSFSVWLVPNNPPH